MVPWRNHRGMDHPESGCPGIAPPGTRPLATATLGIAPLGNGAPWDSPFSRNPAWHNPAERRPPPQTRPATVRRTNARPKRDDRTNADPMRPDRKSHDPTNADPDHARRGMAHPPNRPWATGTPGSDTPRTTIQGPAAPWASLWKDGLAGAERNRWRGMIRDPKKGGQSRRAYCHWGVSFPPAYTARATGSPAGS